MSFVHVGVHVVALIALALAVVLSLAVVRSLVLAVAALQVLRALTVGSIRLDRLAGHVAEGASGDVRRTAQAG